MCKVTIISNGIEKVYIFNKTKEQLAFNLKFAEVEKQAFTGEDENGVHVVINLDNISLIQIEDEVDEEG